MMPFSNAGSQSTADQTRTKRGRKDIVTLLVCKLAPVVEGNERHKKEAGH